MKEDNENIAWPVHPHAGGTRLRRFWRGAISGAALRVINIATQAVSIGITVRYLGSERYGMWSVASTFIVWFALSGAGLGHGLTAKVSAAFGRGEHAAIRRFFSNALVIVTTSCGLMLVGFLLLAQFVPWATVFNVSTQPATDEAGPLVVLCVSTILLTLPLQLSISVLTGIQRTDVANLFTIITTIFGLAFLLVLVRLQATVLLLALALLMPLPMASVLSMAWCFRKRVLRFSWRDISRNEMWSLINLGLQFFFLQFLGIMVFEIGAMIIAQRFGAAEVTPYAVTYRMVMIIIAGGTVMLAPLWPAYGEAFARGEYTWMRRIYLRTLRVVIVFWGCSAVILIFFGKRIVRLWAGEHAVPDSLLLTTMVIYTLSHLLGMIVSFPLNGIAKLKSQLISTGIMAAIHLPLSLWLCGRLGPAGVAASQTICMALVSIPLTTAHFFIILQDCETRTQGRKGAAPLP